MQQRTPNTRYSTAKILEKCTPSTSTGKYALAGMISAVTIFNFWLAVETNRKKKDYLNSGQKSDADLYAFLTLGLVMLAGLQFFTSFSLCRSARRHATFLSPQASQQPTTTVQVTAPPVLTRSVRPS